MQRILTIESKRCVSNGICQKTFFDDRIKVRYANGFCANVTYRWSTREGIQLNSCELFNMYSLCNYLGFSEGIEKLNHKYKNSNKLMFDEESNFCNINYRNIINSKKAIVLYPEIMISSGKKLEYNRYYCNRIDFTPYFDRFISEESRKEIIKKIDFLLSI